MNSRTHHWAGRLARSAAVLAAFLLTGCEGQKIVARVNTVPITEEDFYRRVERVAPNEMPQGSNFDAGSITLISMIVEQISKQYADQKNLKPNEAEVASMVAYLKKTNPLLRNALKTGRFAEDDIVRRVRSLMLDFAIGTNGAQADPAKLEERYKQRVAGFTIPEAWNLQLLPVQDEASGMRAIEELKKSNDFQAAARAIGIPPQVAVTAGQETSLPMQNVDAATKAELDKLAPGQLADKPLKLTVVTPSPQSLTAVVKMVGKEPKYTPSLNDIKFLLTQEIVGETQPQWQVFKNQQLAEATRKADIQINIERYRYLRDVIRSQADQNAMAGVPMGGGAPSSGSAPPPTGGTPPPSGSTAPPTSGAKSPSGSTPPSTSGAKSGSSSAAPPSTSGTKPAPGKTP